MKSSMMNCDGDGDGDGDGNGVGDGEVSVESIVRGVYDEIAQQRSFLLSLIL